MAVCNLKADLSKHINSA